MIKAKSQLDFQFAAVAAMAYQHGSSEEEGWGRLGMVDGRIVKFNTHYKERHATASSQDLEAMKASCTQLRQHLGELVESAYDKKVPAAVRKAMQELGITWDAKGAMTCEKDLLKRSLVAKLLNVMKSDLSGAEYVFAATKGADSVADTTWKSAPNQPLSAAQFAIVEGTDEPTRAFAEKLSKDLRTKIARRTPQGSTAQSRAWRETYLQMLLENCFGNLRKADGKLDTGNVEGEVGGKVGEFFDRGNVSDVHRKEYLAALELLNERPFANTRVVAACLDALGKAIDRGKSRAEASNAVRSALKQELDMIAIAQMARFPVQSPGCKLATVGCTEDEKRRPDGVDAEKRIEDHTFFGQTTGGNTCPIISLVNAMLRTGGKTAEKVRDALTLKTTEAGSRSYSFHPFEGGEISVDADVRVDQADPDVSFSSFERAAVAALKRLYPDDDTIFLGEQFDVVPVFKLLGLAVPTVINKPKLYKEDSRAEFLVMARKVAKALNEGRACVMRFPGHFVAVTSVTYDDDGNPVFGYLESAHEPPAEMSMTLANLKAYAAYMDNDGLQFYMSKECNPIQKRCEVDDAFAKFVIGYVIDNVRRSLAMDGEPFKLYEKDFARGTKTKLGDHPVERAADLAGYRNQFKAFFEDEALANLAGCLATQNFQIAAHNCITAKIFGGGYSLVVSRADKKDDNGFCFSRNVDGSFMLSCDYEADVTHLSDNDDGSVYGAGSASYVKAHFSVKISHVNPDVPDDENSVVAIGGKRFKIECNREDSSFDVKIDIGGRVGS